jgi:ATP-dependent RNA helicase DHX29
MDAKLFCSFFQNAPLLSVPGRTFPVSTYCLEDLLDATDHIIEEGSRFARREDRYNERAQLWVTNRGGEKRRETVDLVSQTDVGDVSDMFPGYKMSTRRSMDRVNEEIINYDLIEDTLNLLLAYPERNSSLLPPDGADLSTGSVLVFLPGLGEIRSLTERLQGSRTLGKSGLFEVIPMHSTLSSRDQRRAFLPPKAGCRKIILSTNIAETSVTIPDVVCGKMMCF